MEIVAQVLGDLELVALRTRYRALGSLAEMVGSSGRFYFYSDPYKFAGTSEEKVKLRAEAQTLNDMSGFVRRKSELAADGIFPRIVCYSEPGNEHLVLFIEFDAKGRRALIASPVWRFWRHVRGVLWIGYIAVGVGLVFAFLGERIFRFGWTGGLFGVSIVALIIFLARKVSR